MASPVQLPGQVTVQAASQTAKPQKAPPPAATRARKGIEHIPLVSAHCYRPTVPQCDYSSSPEANSGVRNPSAGVAAPAAVLGWLRP